MTLVEFTNGIHAETRNGLAVEFPGISRLQHALWHHGDVSVMHLAVTVAIILSYT